MTCEDCAYFEGCNNLWGLLLEDSEYLMNEYGNIGLDDLLHSIFSSLKPKFQVCPKFKDRSRFVELPCKVGDIAYIIHRSKNGGGFIQEVSVSGIHLRDKIGYRNRPRAEYLVVRGNVNLSKHMSLKEIGKTVFLTREEAEQALKLKEREENEKTDD